MSKKTKKIVILNEFELRKTISRLTSEIIEKVKKLDNLLLVGIPTKSKLSRFVTFSIISEVKRERVFLSSTSERMTILFVLLDIIYQEIKLI